MNGSWLATHYWPAACEQGPLRTFWQMFRKSQTSVEFLWNFSKGKTLALILNFKACELGFLVGFRQ